MAAKPRVVIDHGQKDGGNPLATRINHAAASVMFDQFVIRSWDGNSTTDGPDVWELNVAGGLKLLHATFNNGLGSSASAGQSYPGTHPGVTNAPGTGAIEFDSLGYSVSGFGPADSVYEHVYSFTHTAETLVLNFSASGLGPTLADESWGLDNVRVFVTLNGEAPRLVPVGLGANGFTFQVQVEVGWTYIVEASTDLKAWTAIATARPTQNLITVVDPGTPGLAHRFYRVRKLQ